MRRRAFTLIELLVVIAIIGLLSTIAVVALTQSGMNARNTKRKADLLQISKALELYYSDNGQYPSTNGSWRGVCTTFGPYPDSGAGAWIPNLAPTYMAALPRDPNSEKVNPSSAYTTYCGASASVNCYLYNSDSNGADYKLLAHCTPEGTMSATDHYYDANRPFWAWTIYSPGGKNW